MVAEGTKPVPLQALSYHLSRVWCNPSGVPQHARCQDFYMRSGSDVLPIIKRMNKINQIEQVDGKSFRIGTPIGNASAEAAHRTHCSWNNPDDRKIEFPLHSAHLNRPAFSHSQLSRFSASQDSALRQHV